MAEVVNSVDDQQTLLNDEAEANDEDKATSHLLEQDPTEPLTGPETRCVKAEGLKFIITGSIVFALAVTVALIIDIYTGEHIIGGGAVSSDAKECSAIGENILKQGGSAVDAAIATTICVGVVCFESSGIGGGGFMLVQSPEGEVKVIDFREVAPAAATKDMFTKNHNASKKGGLAVAVPGQIRGLELAHQKFGKLKWSELFEPSIKLARNGFKIHDTGMRYLKDELILKDLTLQLKNLMKNPNVVKQPLLAETLKLISSHGSAGFYEGDVAKSVVEAIKTQNGIMTLEDLKNYTAKIREPLISDYHNYRLFTAGAPTSGPVLVSALNILEGFNFTKENRTDKLPYHYLVEALKFAYAQRSDLADPDFVDMENVTNVMMSKQKAEILRELINKSRTYNSTSHYGPFFEAPPNKGTSHVTVIDKSGGLVAVTSTINGPFGSKLYTSTGVLLNNQMDDFSTPGVSNFFGILPAEANFIKPGKRPLSSITPVIAIAKSDLCGHQIVLGAAGGSRITSAVLQVLLNMLSYDQNLTQAIQWPRLHHQLVPMILEAEGEKFSKIPSTEDLVKFLEERGNKVDASPRFRSVVNGAIRQHNKLHAFADKRRADSGSNVF